MSAPLKSVNLDATHVTFMSAATEMGSTAHIIRKWQLNLLICSARPRGRGLPVTNRVLDIYRLSHSSMVMFGRWLSACPRISALMSPSSPLLSAKAL